MKFKIELTWSKLIALLILVLAGYLDITNGGIQAFMYAIPFIVFLITGKQWQDARKEIKLKDKPEKAGCTDPKADNFDPMATIDNGTCTYLANPGNNG